MNTHTKDFGPKQVCDIPLDLLPPHAVMMPDNFYDLAPDDKTVEMACIFSRKNPLGFRETETLTAVLLAWESKAICGFTALELLELNECLPYDEVLGVYLAFLRARAAMSHGEAA